MGYTPIYFQRPMWLQSAPNVAPSPEMEIPHPRVRMNNNVDSTKPSRVFFS